MTQPTSGSTERPAGASARLEEVVERFEQAWQEGPRPDLGQFLPADGPLRRAVLIELVHIDLECRLKAGETVRVEEYLGRYPDLNDDPKAAIDLIVREHELRCQREGQVPFTELAQRFPAYQEVLRQRLQVTRDQEAPTAEHSQEQALLSTGGQASGRNLPPPPGLDLAFLAPPQRRGELGRLGGYPVVKLLGAGGMGLVFQAEDPRLLRRVALKVMRPELAASPLARERFLREARAAAAVRHDHVVTVFRFSRTSGDAHGL
jgi:hypothetical protein